MTTAHNNNSTFLSMFHPVTYSFDNGVYSSIVTAGGVPVTTTTTPNTTTIDLAAVPVTATATPPQPEPKKYVNPFAPEATVPLPLELEDQYGPYSSSVWKRNERERCRVKSVNDGYERLRKHLPIHKDEKRIPKVDTLHLAIRYIHHLDRLLKEHLHQFQCTCFDGFQEESEGKIAVDINAFNFHFHPQTTMM